MVHLKTKITFNSVFSCSFYKNKYTMYIHIVSLVLSLKNGLFGR